MVEKKRRKKYLQTFIYLLLCLFACFVVSMFYGIRPSILIWADNKIYDTYLRSLPKSELSDIPVIIDIDEKSLSAYGQWPWPRYLLASLLVRIYEAGAVAVGIDVLLSEEDRTSPNMIRDNIKRDFGIDISFKGIPDGILDNDKLFASVLEETPTVLGMYVNFSNEGVTVNPLPPFLSLAELGNDDSVADYKKKLITGSGGSSPLEIFSSKASPGVINALTDSDGIIRRIPLLISVNGKTGSGIYGNLGLMTLAKAYGAETIVVKTGQDGAEALRLKGVTVPVDSDGTFPLVFKGGGRSYKYISASDIISENFKKEDLEGKIVFIGSSAPGLLDIRVTPLDEYFPGVEVHASLVDAILSDRYLTIPSWTPGLQVLLIFFASILASIITGWLSPFFSVPFIATLVCGVYFGGYKLFENGYFISPLYALFTLIFTCIAVIVFRLFSEFHQRQVLKNSFGRYVSPEVVARIADRGVAVLSGEEREVSIIFTDIRGFTSISEKLEPEQVVHLLNRYFTPMTAIIRKRKGTIDKFIGDAIMAFWNAPVDVKDHPYHAVSAALEMLRKLNEINGELKKDFGVELRIGAGIHTGKVYVGNMGSEELLSYTIIGDNVNLSSRLEGLCTTYGVSLVVSRDTASYCGNKFCFQYLDKIRVKGRNTPVEVFYVMTSEVGELRSEEIEIYGRAITLYNESRFWEAERTFASLRENFPDSETSRLYEMYTKRCAVLSANPPDDWCGVWTLDSK